MSSIISTYESYPFYEETKDLVEMGIESTCRHPLGPQTSAKNVSSTKPKLTPTHLINRRQLLCCMAGLEYMKMSKGGHQNEKLDEQIWTEMLRKIRHATQQRQLKT